MRFFPNSETPLLHQRDERRDDERRAGKEKRRQLVAERLAGAGRHQRQRRLAGYDVGDDRVLGLVQPLQPEGAAQQSGQARPPRCDRRIASPERGRHAVGSARSRLRDASERAAAAERIGQRRAPVAGRGDGMALARPTCPGACRLTLDPTDPRPPTPVPPTPLPPTPEDPQGIPPPIEDPTPGASPPVREPPAAPPTVIAVR